MFKPQVEYIFRSSNGGVRWCGVDHTNRMYSLSYYQYNGGWRPCTEVRLKDVRALAESARRAGYEEV